MVCHRSSLVNIAWSEEMSLKLDQLRKRLLQQGPPSEQNQHDDQELRAKTDSPHDGAVAETPASAGKEVAAPPPAPEPAPEPEPQILPPATPRQTRPREAATRLSADDHQLSEAVAKVFEQTEAFQSRLKELRAMFEQVERVGKAAADSFAPLGTFRDQLAQLGQSFEPMKAFQAQLADLAQTFEPMRALQDQFSQIADSFQLEIAQLAKALEPARLFREKIADLAKAFDPVGELEEAFRALRDSFQSSKQDGEVLAIERQTAQAGLPN
jgi:DNA repair exonuclease SbcCD ATPase subunit